MSKAVAQPKVEINGEIFKLTRFQSICRHILFKVLNKLTGCQLTFIEKNQVIAVCGNGKADELNASIHVLNPQMYSRFLLGGSIGAGESYIDKDWESDDVTSVVRAFARNLALLDSIEQKFSFVTKPFDLIKHWRRHNSVDQAKQNILAHYDLGNDLYSRFLDHNMQYSSAIYAKSDDTLAQAQDNKLKTICEKLQLSETDHLLEIGTGWGGLAIYAAKHYGCKVTTTTISDAQHAWATEQVEKENLTDKITLLKKDYRELEGQYDKLVSIEMIEAVGKRYLTSFFEQCQRRLKPEGLMVLQAITIRDQRYQSYQRGVDFIQKHIFPGGFLPSLTVLLENFTNNTQMQVMDVHDIGLDYAKTLNHWKENVQQKQSELTQLGYDEQFFRLWYYYLQYCEGGFLERATSTVQVVARGAEHKSTIVRG